MHYTYTLYYIILLRLLLCAAAGYMSIGELGIGETLLQIHLNHHHHHSNPRHRHYCHRHHHIVIIIIIIIYNDTLTRHTLEFNWLSLVESS